MAGMGMKWTLRARFDEVLAKVPERLQAEGFGVMTSIDVKATMKEKLGIDFRRYQILGTCDPNLALEALSLDLGAGVMMPCSVVVYEFDDGTTGVEAVDPVQTLARLDPRFKVVAEDVSKRLHRALAGLAGGAPAR
jgi:uncharacterized protein (DUF302 family)